MGVHVVTVWDCELGYSRTSLAEPTADPDRPDGAEPKWAIWEVDAAGRRGVGEVPHSALEWHAAAHGIDHDDMDTILDSILHVRFVPSPDDALAWQDPVTAAVLEQIADLPDVLTPGVSNQTRREAQLARLAAVKQHLAEVRAAPRADRQAALAYIGSRRIAPADPLGPMRAIRLDPHRVQARTLAVEWRRGGGRPTSQRKPPSTFLGPMLAWPEPPAA